MRRVFRFAWWLVPVSGVYLCIVFHSRWSENRAFVQRLEERQAAHLHAVVEAYGGDRLTILGFYAKPAEIRRGEKAQLCYGVSNSRAVRIEPPVGDVWPSFGRCVEISPKTDTVYTFTAEDANGNTKTRSIAVTVR
jgi:hypothetical protein